MDSENRNGDTSEFIFVLIHTVISQGQCHEIFYFKFFAPDNFLRAIFFFSLFFFSFGNGHKLYMSAKSISIEIRKHS